MKEQSMAGKLFKGTMIIIFVSLLSKVTGFIVDASLASFMGTTYRSDAFYMVTGIQNVIYPMLSIGVWKVFMPIYKEKMTLGQNEIADRLANQVITGFTIVSIAVVAILMLFSNTVVSLIAPGFTGETKRLCSELVAISAPMYVLIMAAAVYATMLQCHNRFLGSQIREAASDIPVIITAIIFYRRYGVRSLAIALVVGGLVRLLVELPFVNWGYRYRPDTNFKSEEFKLILKRLPSALLTEGVAKINTLVDRVMASTLPEGAVSGLNYGNKLMNMFAGVLSTAVSTAMFPQMIELISLKKTKELEKLTSRIICIFAILMIPITVACVLFRVDMVRVVFERGSFDEKSVAITTGTFACYALCLFFLASSRVLNNVFYGSGDTRTPLIIAICNLCTNAGLNIILIKLIGTNGLALATSAAAAIVFIVRCVLIRKYIRLDWKYIITLLIKILIASAIACVVARLVVDRIEMNKYLNLLLAAVIGVGVYLGEIAVLKIDEFHDLTALLKKKLHRA